MIIAENYPYTGNGLGGLPDALEATVTHEINGIYELFLSYPVTGLHYEEIISGRIIMAEPDDLTEAQPFRIYRITKPLNGIVSVYARHICYDAQGIIVEPFTAGSMTEAFQTIPTKCTPSSPITLQTTRSVASGMSIAEPRPLWKLLGGQAGSLLDVYGGEWDFDKLTATLVTTLGSDRGVSVRYGKNMTEMEQDASIEGSYSGVYPYWYDEESNTLVTLTEKIVPVTGSVVSNRVFVLDCSGDFDDAPTEAQLRTRAQAYITNNSIGNVSASWKISFVDTTEGLDRVMLGDTLHVYYERLDVNATARAVKVEYNVLQKRYKSITVGRVKQNLASIIVQQQEDTGNALAEIRSDLETAVDDATDFIRNGSGYMRFIYNGDVLQEIISLDDPDITQAQKVWRWNNGGFGFSSTGYNGPYTLAITQNGAIVADFITAGTLNANVIRAGILQDALGKNSWNLDTGAFTITNGSINITTNYSSTDVIQLNNTTTIGGQTMTFKSTYSPLGLYLTKITSGTTYTTNINADGLYVNNVAASATHPIMYIAGSGVNAAGFYAYALVNDTQKNRAILSANDYLQMYDSNDVLRQSADGNGTLYQYDANGKKRTYLEYGDVFLYTAAEKQTAKLSGAAFPTGGSLQLYDTNAVERVRETIDGLNFYNSSGTQTASYPSTGLPMLSEASAVDSNSYNGKLINLGDVTIGEMGITATDEPSIIEAWLKYVCTRYTNATRCIFEGGIYGTGHKMMRFYIYSTAATSNGLPQYAFGQLVERFGVIWPAYTDNYVLKISNINDYVVEAGTSGSWTYRKWRSGAYECWRTVAPSIAINSAWGSNYYGALSQYDYPVTFSERPYEQVSVRSGSGWAWIVGGTTISTTSKTGAYYLMRSASASSQQYYVDYYVRGYMSS